MFFNFALAQGVMTWFDSRWAAGDSVSVDRAATRRWLAVAAGVTAVWIVISLIILSSAQADQPTVRVAALQPGYERAAFWDESRTSQERFDAVADWTRDAAGQGAQIIYTPEMHFNVDPQVALTDQSRALALETGTYMLINYSYGVEGEPWRNEAVLLSPSGEFSDVYAKNHAPPGEPLSPSAGVYPVYDTPLGRLAAMICHDANYTNVARRLARGGAQLISASLSEFGGFGEQFWTNATFRAVENRVAVVVTARQTGSAIIDPSGRQLALDLTPNQQAILVHDVPLGSGNAPYTFLGDWLGWLSLAAYVFFVALQVVTERRAKQTTEANG